jgi:hypothetical protein
MAGEGTSNHHDKNNIFDLKTEDETGKIKFLVGRQKTVIWGNRRLLENILHFCKESNKDEITVNCSMESIETFLKSAEGKKINITTPHLALELNRLAEKFLYTKLQIICYDYLKNNYRSVGALLIWEYAESYDMSDFANKCHNYASENVREIFESEDFLKSRVETIAKILANDKLAVNGGVFPVKSPD